MRMAHKFKRTDETKESMELKATAEVDAALRDALTDGDCGVLKPGCLPKVEAATASGSKELLNAISQAWMFSHHHHHHCISSPSSS